MNARLLARVQAVNKANNWANRLQPVLLAAFGPLVGQAILKQNSDLLQKYEKVMPVLPNEGGVSVYRSRSNYSLAWTVKVCQHDGEGSCCYAEQTVYVANLEGAVLKSLYEPYTHKTDYRAEDVVQARKNLDDAETAVREAQSALSPFPRHDN